jgi:MYXO-CTERM domain-containing protein
MMNVSFVAAPAPGALALLGIAGIAGSRRRR